MLVGSAILVAGSGNTVDVVLVHLSALHQAFQMSVNGGDAYGRPDTAKMGLYAAGSGMFPIQRGNIGKNGLALLCIVSAWTFHFPHLETQFNSGFQFNTILYAGQYENDY